MIYEWLQNIKFLWPQCFLLLLLLPLLIAHYVYRQAARPATFIANTAEALPVTFKIKLRHLPFILRMVAIACIITALARPQYSIDKSRYIGEGIDIVMCMDVSKSMSARDVSPSRLAAAKEVAAAFVQKREVDRIGLVVFSGESFTKCPITSDKNTIIAQIESLQISDGGYLEPGTLIGEGLATSVNRIAKGNAKSKVVILLTDGKEDAPATRIIDPEMATQLAIANNVKVYCIGIGGGTAFAGVQLVKGGGLVRDFIDEALLKKIAAATGGRYYRATDINTLTAVYDQIDRLEKTKVQAIQYAQTRETYVPLVLAALALLFFELVLNYTWLKKYP